MFDRSHRKYEIHFKKKLLLRHSLHILQGNLAQQQERDLDNLTIQGNQNITETTSSANSVNDNHLLGRMSKAWTKVSTPIRVSQVYSHD